MPLDVCFFLLFVSEIEFAPIFISYHFCLGRELDSARLGSWVGFVHKIFEGISRGALFGAGLGSTGFDWA